MKRKKVFRFFCFLSLLLALAILCACASGTSAWEVPGGREDLVSATESREDPEEPSVQPEPQLDPAAQAQEADPLTTDTAPTEPDRQENDVQENAESQGIPDEKGDDLNPEDAVPQPLGHYTFRPKVCSVYMEEIFGKTMCETWFNLVDAVMAGETTFACPDQHTYDWVMGQFPERCFPVLIELIDYAWDREHSVIDGVASFTYLLPYEEVSARIASFAELIEGILNESLADDYTDFEKALALYQYFAATYEYDYDTYYLMESQAPDDVTAISFLESGVGICQEISFAYSYLLMQAGVDATVMSGHRGYDFAGHQWSYVRINGSDYHIDPTYGLGNGPLDYFMMTDEQREEMDDYKRKYYVPTSVYAQEYPSPVYTADDETFRPLWGHEYAAFDHEKRTLYYYEYVEDGTRIVREFDYSGY